MTQKGQITFPNSSNTRLDGTRSAHWKSYPEWLPFFFFSNWGLFKILTGNRKVLLLPKKMFESHCTQWKYLAIFSRMEGCKSGWGITLQHSYHRRTASFSHVIVILKCKCEQVNTELLLWAENFARFHFI